jgi:hypothetical protein
MSNAHLPISRNDGDLCEKLLGDLKELTNPGHLCVFPNWRFGPVRP